MAKLVNTSALGQVDAHDTTDHEMILRFRLNYSAQLHLLLLLLLLTSRQVAKEIEQQRAVAHAGSNAATGREQSMKQ